MVICWSHGRTLLFSATKDNNYSQVTHLFGEDRLIALALKANAVSKMPRT